MLSTPVVGVKVDPEVCWLWTWTFTSLSR